MDQRLYLLVAFNVQRRRPIGVFTLLVHEGGQQVALPEPERLVLHAQIPRGLVEGLYLLVGL